MTLKHITTFIYRNEKFEIVKNSDGYYLAISSNDIDEHGILKRKLNGLQCHASKKLSFTLDCVMNALDIKAHNFTSEDLQDGSILADVISGRYRA